MDDPLHALGIEVDPLGVALSLEHNFFSMGPMSKQGRHSQQHGNDRHGQADFLFSMFMGVFGAFFELFYVHDFISVVRICTARDPGPALFVRARDQCRCRNLSLFCGRTWSGTSSYFRTLMEPSTSSTARAASLMQATPCSRRARLSSSMETCSFAK